MLPHVADGSEYSARSRVRHKRLQAHSSFFTNSLSAADFILRRIRMASVSASTIIHCFVFNTEEQARRKSASHNTVSETAVASTTSVTKLERLTRKSGMKRTHAGITFEELFGTSLEFGLCHLSHTCCFFFAPINLTPADFFKWRTCAGGEAFISFLGLPFDLFLLTITSSFPRAERSLALCPEADAGEPS